MKADYDQTDLPATLRNTLYHALLNYSKFKLLVDDHINGFCKLARGRCPFCDYMASEGLMVPVSLDGNFQLKRLDQTSHSFVNDPCAETVNTLWKANTNILSPGNKPQSSVTNVRTEFSLSNDSIQLTTQRSYNYDNIACDGWKSLSKTGIKRKSVPTTGVFMTMCSRHSFVLSLMDMNTTGEKADYPLSVLYQIKNTYGNNIAILYDVACKMGKGLKHTPQLSDLANVPRAIGAFHVYGHDAPCQVAFNPKVVKGIGLVDGEDCERYWSVCSPFVTATRYMTEYNRHLFFTILTDHYHEQKLKSLGRIIFKKYGKAKNILKDSNDKLRRIDVEELARHWEEFKYGTIEGRSSNMRSRRMNEKDKLRAAVLAYDCFNEVMHGGRLGNKRAMEMQVQLSKALKKVDNIVQEYNNNNPTSRIVSSTYMKAT
ncbi:hypothetical protein BDC45DRAFT_140724 [Circinella umbellata]|nr:hypothetical protein BDC45DRAFT_140724 [Circinella umbellata]